MMQEDLRSMILASVSVASVVQERVYWGERPQGSRVPAVVLTRISEVPTYHMEGVVGLTETRVQIDGYAATYAASEALRSALDGLLSGYRGTFGGTRFAGIFSEGARDFREIADADRYFRVSTDFIIHHVET